jgi:DNA-directed RNA polymerase specialized sigma24 family protein
MAQRGRDFAFTRFVAEHRSLLTSVALLMFADHRRAEDVVQWSLAEVYRRWPRQLDPRLAALRLVLHAMPEDVALPWRRQRSVELVDALQRPAEQPSIVADLATLSAEPRRVLILQHLCRLPVSDIAAVSGSSEARVEAWAQQAEADLARLGPERLAPGRLREELAGTLEPQPDTTEVDLEGIAATDLAHGRLLDRRRRFRSAVLVTAVLVALTLGAAQLVTLQQMRQERAQRPQQETARSSAPSPVSPAVTPRPACDMETQSCQDAILRRWGTEVASIATSYVDPRRTYFSGGSSSLNGRYDANSWWRGQVGALELDLAPKRRGATAVHLEIAATSDSATPCGQRTGQPCTAMHSRDKISLSATRAIGMSRGMEVQYVAEDEHVISAIARNTSGSKELEITEEQLVALVSDPRLRLPPL